MMNHNSTEKKALKVSFVTIMGNTALSGLKLIAGWLGHSNAMLSDAVHSLSDVFSTIIVMIGVKLSSRAADHDHPYGHEKMESIASMLLAIMLAATGLAIGKSALEIILNQDQHPLVIPGTIALIASIISILTKEAMFWYTIKAAREIHSDSLKADAWHHRSDAMSSVGSLIGIAGAKLGYPILDPLASLVICIFIFKVAFDIFRDSMNKMVDHACDEETEAAIKAAILKHPEVKHIDDLKTRMFGNRIYIDVEIALDRQLPLIDADQIAHHVHDTIEQTFPLVKHCMVHANPDLTQ